MTSSTPDGSDALDVDPAQAARNADLFESYARYAADEIAVSPEETRWQAEVDAASAFRTAGQWALLVDPRRARRLLVTAADHFSSTYGYAAFLRAVAGAPTHDVLADSRQLLELNPQPLPPTTGVAPGGSENLGAGDESGDVEEPAPVRPGLRHPQQQAYLLLALSAERNLPPQARNDLLVVSRHDGRLHEGHAVGAVGLPLWRFWRAARLLLDGQLGSLAAEILVPLDHRYTDATRGAQSNSHLWKNAASPVDVVDMEIVGVSALTVHRYGAEDVLRVTARTPMSPAMTSLVQHGVQLASADDDFTPDDHHH